MKKTYWAFVEGNVAPQAGTWTDHLCKVPDVARVEVVPPEHPEGRLAVLHYRVLANDGRISWLEIDLETGRMHQIRVQAASRSHPVLGDEQYGATTPFGPVTDDFRRRWIALHARSLEFRHPMTRQIVSQVAPSHRLGDRGIFSVRTRQPWAVRSWIRRSSEFRSYSCHFPPVQLVGITCSGAFPCPGSICLRDKGIRMRESDSRSLLGKGMRSWSVNAVDQATFSSATRLRIGAVSYLNTKPLVYGLPALAPNLETVFDVPSRLADDLHAGRLDVALIPSIEYTRHPECAIVSNACIGCRGPVLSVKLLGRKPLRTIDSLALDEGSRTSGWLARILLWKRYRLQPRLEVLPIDCGLEDSAADAVLLIGDRAIHPPPSDFVECWDLGDEWCRWAELPFVFAMWVARPGVDVVEMGHVLNQARDWGVAHLEEIARAEAARVGLTYEQTLGYLRDHLHFYLNGREQRGLDLFFQLVTEIEAIPAERNPQFHDCQVT